MKGRLIVIGIFYLMSWVLASPRLSKTELRDNYELPPDDAEDFFRLLLLSRYGLGLPDYESEEEKSSYDNYFGNTDADNTIHPFRQAVKNYANWKKENQKAPEDQIIKDQTIKDIQSNLVAQSEQVNQHLTDSTTKEQPSTTSGPDLLASIPPVTPNKGQKEYVMLRPPVDNHRKIEHWMQSMANGMFGMNRHIIQKRGGLSKGRTSN